MDGIAVAGEVASAGTALAGLILVYLGVLATGFDSFEPQERRSARPRFVMRAWIAFVGIVLALLTALLAVFGKATGNACSANAALILLLVSFVWGGAIAFLTVREIN